MLLTNGKINDIICPYLTILEVEVAFTKTNCAEAESQRNTAKGVDAEIHRSNCGLGLHLTGAELSTGVLPASVGALSKVVVLGCILFFDEKAGAF